VTPINDLLKTMGETGNVDEAFRQVYGGPAARERAGVSYEPFTASSRSPANGARLCSTGIATSTKT
jgi:hypothetical protein